MASSPPQASEDECVHGEPMARLTAQLEAFDGTCAFHAEDLGSGDALTANAGVVLEVASAYKLLPMIAAYGAARRGELDLDEPVTLAADEWMPGSGLLRELTGPAMLTVRDLIRLMILASDNSATAWLLRRLGANVVNRLAGELGLRATRLHLGERGYATSTARELATLMRLIARDEAVDAQACGEMRDALGRQHYLDQIPRYLPVNPYAEDYATNAAVVVMNKTGFSHGIRADAAIVEVGDSAPIVMACICNWAADGDPVLSVDEPASVLIATLARMIVDTFRPGAITSPYATYSDWMACRR